LEVRVICSKTRVCVHIYDTVLKPWFSWTTRPWMHEAWCVILWPCKISLLGAAWLCLLNTKDVTVTWSRMCYHRFVSCYVCLPDNICLSRRPEGTNDLFLAIAYKSLIIPWLKNVNDSTRMPPALYTIGHTSQYGAEQRMERRERMWNPSQLYWWSENANPVCLFHGLPFLVFRSFYKPEIQLGVSRILWLLTYCNENGALTHVKKRPFRKNHHASHKYDCGILGNQSLRQNMDVNHSRHKLLLISTNTGLTLHSWQKLIHLLILS
jgi:hypothetical protein